MDREAILRALRQGAGEYVSGEQLSAALGMTRAAVWKEIRALRDEGYEIESKTRCGYRLVAMPDRLCAEAVRALITPRTVGREVLCFDTLDSTNNYAKQAAQNGAENGLVVIANQQTGGRGRCGRTFLSPPDRGLYLTALLRPDIAPADALPITALAAVAACRAVEKVCPLQSGIKWTNDLVLGNRKLAGILTEMGVEGESGALQYIVIGIGINVNQTAEDFPPELAEVGTSLHIALGKPVSRTALAAALIGELDGMYDRLGGDLTAELAEYRRRCVTLGRRVRILGSGMERTAEALDVDEAFGLIVRREDGTLETVRSGEVSVRGLYGYV